MKLMLPVAAVPRAIVRQRAEPDLAKRVHRPIRGVFQRQHRVDAAQPVDLCLAIGLDGDVRRSRCPSW